MADSEAPRSPAKTIFGIVAIAAAAGAVYWVATRTTPSPAGSGSPGVPAVPADDAATRLAHKRVLASVHYTNSKLEDPSARDEVMRAVDEAEECCRMAPNSDVDRLNLAITLLRFYDERKLRVDAASPGDWVEKAKPILKRAIGLVEQTRTARPDLAVAHFHAAMAHVRRGKLEAADPDSDWRAKAREAAAAYWKIEDRSAAVRYHIGAMAAQDRDYAAAEVHLRRAIELDPDHPNAYYQLAQALIRQEKPKELYEPLIARHAELQEKIGKARAQWDPDAVFDFAYPELIPIASDAPAGDAADAVRMERVDGPPAVVLQPMLLGDAANAPGALSPGADASTLARAGLWAAAGTKNQFLQFDGTKISIDGDKPAELTAPVLCAVSADIDGDHAQDLLVGGSGITWIRAESTRRPTAWKTASAPGLPGAGVNVFALAAADFDADGDLDLIALEGRPGAAQCTFYRADPQPAPAPEDTPPENTTFVPAYTPVKLGELGLAAPPDARAVALLDYDGRNDTDVLIAGEKSSMLFANRRGMKFEKVADLPGALACTTGDVDGDGMSDVVLANADGISTWSAAAPAARRIAPGPLASPCLMLADLENRGLLDVVAFAENKVLVLRRAGGPEYQDVAKQLFPAGFQGAPTACAAQDLDGDYDLDVAVARGAAQPSAIYINRGGERTPAAALTFRGTKTNRSGLGTRVEVRSRGVRQVREAWQLPVFVAGGGRSRIDGVFLKWTNGIDEAQGDVAASRYHYALERRGREGSCPFIYTWNGTRFEFVTDAIGATPLGLWAMPGMYVPPQDREWLRIRGGQLAPRNGKYEIHFTEEMRETTYLDRVRLMCIDHPAGTNVYPDERFCFPPFPEKKLLLVREERPVKRAWNDRREDVTELLAKEDRRFASPPERLAYQGMAPDHALILDLGEDVAGKELMLFLTGWFGWTNSSINRAIFDAHIRFTPPSVEVLAAGADPFAEPAAGAPSPWRVVVEDAGFPAGMQKTMAIDLAEKLKPGEHVLRIKTNLQLHWDRAFVSVGKEVFETKTTELPASSAELRFHGVARWKATVAGAPTEPDYADATREHVYDLHTGDYTRYGDVLPLLADADNQMVIFPHGDEVALEFDASKAPPIPAGWTRTFILDSHGWAKDADPNTFAPTTVEPLPFIGMSGYPYSEKEHYPETEELQKYRREWNTRRVDRPRPLPVFSGIEAIHEK